MWNNRGIDVTKREVGNIYDVDDISDGNNDANLQSHGLRCSVGQIRQKVQKLQIPFPGFFTLCPNFELIFIHSDGTK